MSEAYLGQAPSSAESLRSIAFVPCELLGATRTSERAEGAKNGQKGPRLLRRLRTENWPWIPGHPRVWRGGQRVWRSAAPATVLQSPSELCTLHRGSALCPPRLPVFACTRDPRCVIDPCLPGRWKGTAARRCTDWCLGMNRLGRIQAWAAVFPPWFTATVRAAVGLTAVHGRRGVHSFDYRATRVCLILSLRCFCRLNHTFQSAR